MKNTHVGRKKGSWWACPDISDTELGMISSVGIRSRWG
jgi:hypothetical protein